MYARIYASMHAVQASVFMLLQQGQVKTERCYLAALLQKSMFSINLHRRAVLSCLSIAA